jgi:GDP-L-fucose synthase
MLIDIMNVLVTGGSGLVGNALQNISNNHKLYKFIFLSSSDCDLENYEETMALFKRIKPEFVIHLAANVGGLYKNLISQSSMLEKNLLINTNVLKCAHELKVRKCISCLSTCIFPDKVLYPIDETSLHDGPPHESNYGYAYAKRILDVQSKAYRDQYNDNFICVIPTNIYGKNDNFNLENAHVIPALIHQCYLAKKNKKPFIVKGSGRPLRQFIYSIDLAKLILWTLEEYNGNANIALSVGPEEEKTIENIARIIAKCFDYEFELIFDTSFSDGQYKKTCSNKKLMENIETFDFTSINIGIKETINWFIENYKICRK